MSARLSQKLATENSSMGKKVSRFTVFEGRILKQKHRSATKDLYDFLIILQLLYLAQSNIFWRCAHVFH